MSLAIPMLTGALLVITEAEWKGESVFYLRYLPMQAIRLCQWFLPLVLLIAEAVLEFEEVRRRNQPQRAVFQDAIFHKWQITIYSNRKLLFNQRF